MKQVAVNKNDKNGIALVIVLGFILLLVVMAVSFVEIIRGERAASAAMNWGDQRDMAMQMAVSQVITDINELMDDAADSAAPGEPDGFLPRDAFNSRVYKSPGGTVVNVLGSLSNISMVPKDVFTQSPAQYMPGISTKTLPLKNVFNSGFSDRDLSYAFLAVDMSDYIDFNWQMENAFDTNSTTFAWSELPDLSAPSSYSGVADMFSQLNQLYDRINTCSEIAMELEQPANAAGRFSPAPYFSTYSLYPRGANIGNQVAYPAIDLELLSLGLTGLPKSLQGASIPSYLVTQVREAAGILGQNPQNFLDALYDYIDEDRIPRYLNKQCVEATPLINELKVEATTIGAGESRSVGYKLQVELWYPFVGRPMKDAVYNVSAVLNSISGAVVEASPFGTQSVEKTWDWEVGDPLLFETVDFTTQARSDERDGGFGAIEVTVTLKDYNGNEVDEATVKLNTGGAGIRYAEVEDPRLNWDTSFWSDGSTGTMGSINKATTDYFSSGDPNDFDSIAEAFMYVGDVARFKSSYVEQDTPIPAQYMRHVGELGFLMAGNSASNAWQTLDTADVHADLYDLFHWGYMGADMAYSSYTEGYSRGLFNPNNDDPDVWAAFLKGLNIRTDSMYKKFYDELYGENYGTGVVLPLARSYPAYPEGPLQEIKAVVSDLDNIAAYMANNAGGYGVFTSKADVAYALGQRLQSNPVDWLATDALEDGFISTVVDHLSVRQNLIGVYCWIGIEGPKPLTFLDDRILNKPYNAQGRAFFLLWRDPLRTVPDGKELSESSNSSNKGYHRNFVKYFQWLDEF